MAEVANGDIQTNGHATSPSSQPTNAMAPSQQSSQPDAMATPTRPPVPRISLEDDGQSKRPRDVRVIHTILSGQGINAYQERVPLQLIDFAYRHTSSILSDALHLSSDAYLSQQSRAKDGPPGGIRDVDGQVSIPAIKLAIESRQQYQFNLERGGLSRPFLAQIAEERNKVALPKVALHEWGVRLPAEKFVLTGVPWGLREEWEEVGKDEGMLEQEGGNTVMNGTGDLMDEEDGMEGGEEGEGRMEDLFGGDVDEGDKDVDME